MTRNMVVHTFTRGISVFIVAALLVTLANMAAPILEVHAATINVDTTDDGMTNNGDCTLREAIQAANTNSVVDNCTAGQAAPSLDIITFGNSTNGIPIVLVDAAGEDANASGDLDILDGGDLIIQGNGTVSTIIDGNGADRVFHICPGGGCAHTVTIKSVTIRNGSADFGGGILNQGATLNVQDSTIGGAGVGNSAIDEGGGIENQGGTTTLVGTTVTGNEAQYGGGICNHATLNVQNGSIIGGAGASNMAENGGGIYNFAGTTTVEASTVISNSATDGGGIYNYAGTTMVDHSAIVYNNATDDGGGIHVQDGTTTLEASTVSDNNANDYGGGIYNHATLNVQNSTIGGSGAGNNAIYGGGIHNFTGQTTVDSSTISGNGASYGAGIYSHNAATLNVQNGSTIGGAGAGNTATSDGGGIYNGSGSTTTVDASTVNANTATSYGGGIFNLATLNLNNSTIGGAGAGNTATVDGGGIYNGTDGTTWVDGSDVIYNTAGSSGGGISNWFGTTTVEGSSIISNTAIANGGGITNYYGTTTVDSSYISLNTAPFGGGIYNHATLNVTDSTIGGAGAGNTASAGGGIHNWFGTAMIISSVISGNTASLGGGVYNDAVSTVAPVSGGSLLAASLSIQNSTIGGVGAGNTATTAGGGIYNGYEFTLQVLSSRIIHNIAPNGGGVFSWNEIVGATSVTGSCIVGNSDISFFNDKAAQQTATGNWWGVAGGPGAPGADTVGGPVDTTGFLNTPAPSCEFDVYLPLVRK